MNVPYVAKKIGEFIKEGKNSPEVASLCEEVSGKPGPFVNDLFYKVAHSITYVKEPEGNDVWQTPKETLKGWGDCEDFAILLASVAVHKKVPCMVKFVAIDGEFINHVYPVLYDEPSDTWLACDATPNHNARLGFEADYRFADLYRVNGGIWPVGREVTFAEPSSLFIILLFVGLVVMITSIRLVFRS